MIHDFAISEYYLIVPDLPVEFDVKGAIKDNKFVFNYNKNGTSRYGIVPREDKDGKRVLWFETEAHSVFHFGNAWDSQNSKGEHIVTLIACVHSDISIGLQQEHFDVRDGPKQCIEKFEFNLATKEHTRKKMAYEKCEFPIINQDFIGHKNRYVYFASIQPETDSNPPQKCLDNGFYNSLIKFDCEKE